MVEASEQESDSDENFEEEDVDEESEDELVEENAPPVKLGRRSRSVDLENDSYQEFKRFHKACITFSNL